jgi:DNA polymerase III sliding clamp (beta) subunit (PCNA family)
MKITVDHKLHKVCEHKDSLRTALTGVYFDKQRSQLVATDGHVLAISPVEDCKDDHSCIIPAKAYSETLKTKTPCITTLSSIPKDIRAMQKDSIEIYKPIKEQYPRYEMVLPKEGKPLFKLGLNAKLLYKLSQALGDDQLTLTFTNHNMKDRNGYLTTDSAIKVTALDQDSTGLIMPMRVRED